MRPCAAIRDFEVQSKMRQAMKKLLGAALVAAALPLVGACAKSVDRAQRDVQRTHDQAVQNIERKQEDLQDAKRDAEDRVAQKERRLEDTVRSETDKIRKEERALEDAVRAEEHRKEAERSNRDTPVPDVAPPVP